MIYQVVIEDSDTCAAVTAPCTLAAAMAAVSDLRAPDTRAPVDRAGRWLSIRVLAGTPAPAGQQVLFEAGS